MAWTVEPLQCFQILPPASEASRELLNLTERKNSQTPVYGVKKFLYLSVHGQL